MSIYIRKGWTLNVNNKRQIYIFQIFFIHFLFADYFKTSNMVHNIVFMLSVFDVYRHIQDLLHNLAYYV